MRNDLQTFAIETTDREFATRLVDLIASYPKRTEGVLRVGFPSQLAAAERLAEACESSDAAFEILHESIRKTCPSPTALYLIEGQRQELKAALAAYREGREA